MLQLIHKLNGGKQMNTNFKKLTAIALVSTIMATTVACAPETTTSSSASSATPTTSTATSNTETEPAEKTTITLWTGDRHDLVYMEKVVADFNNADNGIFIDYVVQTENMTNMLMLAASSGQYPDVHSAQNNLSDFVTSGLIQPINDFMTPEFIEVLEADQHVYQNYNAIGEDIYFMPAGRRSGSRIIYNKTVMDELGMTVPDNIPDFVDMCIDISEEGNGDYYGIIFPGASGPFERWIQHSAAKSGIHYYDYENGRYDFTDFAPMLHELHRLFSDGAVFPSSTSLKIDPARVQFAEGGAIIHANASQEVTVFTEQFPITGFEWAVAELPTMDGTINGVQHSGPNGGRMMSSQTEHPEEAWEVIEYLQSESVLIGYYEGGYSLPFSGYLMDKADLSKAGKMGDFSYTSSDYESFYPTVPTVAPQGEVWEAALWNALVAGGDTIDETIETLNKTYNEALDRDVELGKIKRLVVEDYDPMNPQGGTQLYLDK